MKSSLIHSKKGFTIIETLVYLGLYAIIMGGAITAVYTIFSSSAHNQTQAMIQEEGSYLLGKIDWVLSNAHTVEEPVSTGSVLSIIRFDGSSASISQNGKDMQIIEGSYPLQVLNNTNITIRDLVFIHTNSSADGINPESVQASFTVYATTSDGLSFSRSFVTVKYLRK
jgi:type II secretory pathway pseudopilin PulG